MSPDFVPSPNAPTVLLVDDEAAVRDFVRIVLTHAGYAVISAADARQALELFQADPERFAVVISDIRMPVRSGLELGADLHALRPEVPVVFMSGFVGGNNGNQPLALPPGAIVLEKPFTRDGILQAIQQAIKA
ncbi:MAG: response regulator [Gemmataceae bacterium]